LSPLSIVAFKPKMFPKLNLFSGKLFVQTVFAVDTDIRMSVQTEVTV